MYGNTQSLTGPYLEPNQYQPAVRLARRVAAALPTPLTFAGHSLGGGLASAAAVATGGSAATYNSAGLSYLSIIAFGGFFGDVPKVDAYRVRGDWLTQFQELDPVSAGVLPDAFGQRWTLPDHPNDPDVMSHSMVSMLMAFGER